MAGVYELRLQLEVDDENIWSRLRRRPPPLLRVTHPIAVLHGDVGTEDRTDSLARGWDDSSIGIRLVGRPMATQAQHTADSGEPASQRFPIWRAIRMRDSPVSLIPPLGMFQATLASQYGGLPAQSNHPVAVDLHRGAASPSWQPSRGSNDLLCARS